MTVLSPGPFTYLRMHGYKARGWKRLRWQVTQKGFNQQWTKGPSRRARGSPHCGSHKQTDFLEVSPKPAKPNTLQCTWLSRSPMPQLGTPTIETQTWSSTEAALWSGLHKSHHSESYLTLLYSWHRLGPSGSPEWSACLHSLKGYCETRQSMTTKINEGDRVAGSRASQVHNSLTEDFINDQWCEEFI